MADDQPPSTRLTRTPTAPSPYSDEVDEFIDQFYGSDSEENRVIEGLNRFQGQRQQIPREQGLQLELQREEPAQRVRLTRPWHPYSGLGLSDINIFINQNSEARVGFQDETSGTNSPTLGDGDPFRLVEEQDLSEIPLAESQALVDNENGPTPIDGSDSESIVELLPATRVIFTEGEVDGVPAQIWELASTSESWSNNPGSVVATTAASTPPLERIGSDSLAAGLLGSDRTAARSRRERATQFINPWIERAESPDTVEIIDTDYIPPPRLQRRDAIIGLSLIQNGNEIDETSLNSPSTESVEGSASVPEEDQYSFSQERRQQLMREMMSDMNRFDAQREIEFGHQHGYQLYPRSNAPASVPETSIVAQNPTVRELHNVTDRRADLLNVVRGSDTQTRRPRRRAMLRPNRVQYIDGIEEDADASPTTEAVRRRGVSTIGNMVRRRTELSLTIATPDFTEEFLRYLLSEWRWTTEETNSVFPSSILRNGGARWRYSLRDMPSQNSTPTTEDFELFRAVLPRLEDNQVLLAQVFAAVHDGMDVREAYEFIEQWCGYTLNWRNPFLQIPGMIEIQALQFWVALRRGWGGWKPSDACLSNVRRRLTQGSLVNHLPEERTVFEMAAPDADHVVRFEIQETGLPDLEMDRLCHLLQEGIDAQRVSVMVQNWNSSSDWIEASRMPTERSVSIARLRLDRLERMIREENVVNARQIAPPRPVVRHVRMYDGPQ